MFAGYEVLYSLFYWFNYSVCFFFLWLERDVRCVCKLTLKLRVATSNMLDQFIVT